MLKKQHSGSGQNKNGDFININKIGGSDLDLIIDLKKAQWAFENVMMDKILFSHILGPFLKRSRGIIFSNTRKLSGMLLWR